MRKRTWQVAGSTLILSAMVSSSSLAQTNIELVIDSSGSMAQRVDGRAKMDIAKEVFSGLIEDLPADAQIAVRTYGRNRKDDCADMEVLVPFGPNEKTRVQPGVKSLKPVGKTPISASLIAAAKDFAGREGQNNIIILLSDGEESCDADPCAAAKSVHESGIQLQVNVIGFNVTAKEKVQLECIANAAGGKYYDAANAGELKVAARAVKEQLAAPPVEAPKPPPKAAEPLYGEPIRGGDSYDAPVELPAGKLFHLDHDQPRQAHDFFTVKAKGGQAIVVTVKSGANGYSGIFIHDAQHQVLVARDLGTGGLTEEVRRDIADQQDGTYFILVGSTDGIQQQDSTFRLDLVSIADANSDRDAGANEARALDVVPGTYPSNYMSDVDAMDVFKFRAEAGQSYQFKARPQRTDAIVNLVAIDADGVKLAEGSSPNPGAVAKIEMKPAGSGSVFVNVSYYHYGNRTGSYAFAFGPGDVESPAAPQ